MKGIYNGKDYFELEALVESWSEDRGILDKATPMAQALKTLEETTELCVAVNSEDRIEIIDSIGDILVTLIIQCQLQDLKIEQCLESAYKVIAKRKGKMINGQFVKEESLPEGMVAGDDIPDDYRMD
ncbi:MAG: nucleotide pyrophosphohydrolase [Nitrospinae bacterium]|nr:nucleotide pyrophosphohydrolase [Nitrospinota bacterium]